MALLLRSGKMQYQMTLTSEQMKVLIRALDLYTRMGIGQFSSVLSEMMYLHPGENSTMFVANNDPIAQPMKEIQRMLTGHGDLNASYGIGNPKVHADATNGVDILHACQEAVAKNEKHGSHSVWHWATTVKYGNFPLPVIEIKDI